MGNVGAASARSLSCGHAVNRESDIDSNAPRHVEHWGSYINGVFDSSTSMKRLGYSPAPAAALMRDVPNPCRPRP